MPRIKITNLPKYKLGGPDNCEAELGPGYVWDESLQMCVQDTGYKPVQTVPTNPNSFNVNSIYPGPLYRRNFHSAGTGTADSGSDDKKCPDGYVKDANGRCVLKKRGIEYVANTLNTMRTFGSALAQASQNEKNRKAFETQQRNKLFLQSPSNPGRQFTLGHVETQSGVEYPGSLTPPNEGMFSNPFMGVTAVQFGGGIPSGESSQTRRIKILEGPQMKYGGQFKGSYGFDSGWRNLYTDMAKTDAEHYGETMSENSNPNKVLEGEGGETLYKPGDDTLHNIEGNRHTHGGVKLTQDQVESKNSDIASFIFSDTKKLKIKDKEILDYFGVPYAKGGVTPAKISKRFPLNQYKAILDDPYANPYALKAAKLMQNKNTKYLADLAAIQEGMKGQAPPEFAQKQGEAKYGGVPKYAEGGDGPGDPDVKLGEWSDDYETLEKLLKSDNNKALRDELYNRFKKANPKATITQDEYIDNLLTAQKHNYAIAAAHEKDPEFLTNESWDWGNKKTSKHGAGWKNKRYNEEVTKLGMTPLSIQGIKQFQQAYRDLQDAMQDPVFFQSFGKYFATDPTGVHDSDYRGKPISPVEGFYGNTTVGQKFKLSGFKDEPPVTTTTTAPPEVKAPKYICILNDKGESTVVESEIGYDSEPEARQHCGEKPKRAPFGFLLPDKANMLATAALFPEVIFPFNPEMAKNARPLSLEDWRAKAAHRFSTQYAAPSEQLAQYTSPQALMANLSMLSGQTGQQMAAEDIAPTISRNVDRVNQYSAEEAKRQDEINTFNLLQKEKRYQGWATAKQQYDNSLRQYLKNNVDAFTRAWNNRMRLGQINDTNSKFYLDYTSGRQVYYNPNTQGFAGLQGGSAAADASDYGSVFNKYYAQFYKDINDPSLTKEQRSKAAAELTMSYLKSSMTTETESDDGTIKRSKKKTTFDFGS